MLENISMVSQILHSKKKKKTFYQANMSSAEKSDRNRTYYYGIAKKRLNVAMRTIASLSTTKT